MADVLKINLLVAVLHFKHKFSYNSSLFRIHKWKTRKYDNRFKNS